jgi:hypothetical protein
LNDLLRLNPGLDEDAYIPSLTLVTFRGIRPAQLVLLSRRLPDTLILQEIST